MWRNVGQNMALLGQMDGTMTETAMPLPASRTRVAAAAALLVAAPLFIAAAAAEPLAPTTFLNLRTAPDKTAPVVGVLRPGIPVDAVAGTPAGWLQVRSPDGPGWAYGEFYRR